MKYRNKSKTGKLILAICICIIGNSLITTASEQTVINPNESKKISVTLSSEDNTEPTDPEDPDEPEEPINPPVMPPTIPEPDENGYSIVVPLYLPINIKEDGNMEVANNAKIINYSANTIVLKDIRIDGINDWEVGKFDYNYQHLPANDKKFAMSINGENTNDLGIFSNTDNWGEILTGEENALDLNYEIKIAPQINIMSKTNIANVTFVVDWVN